MELLVSALLELPLNSSIVHRAIDLRRQRKMSLADAMIASTALIHHVALITRNEDDFADIPELELINPFRRPESKP